MAHLLTWKAPTFCNMTICFCLQRSPFSVNFLIQWIMTDRWPLKSRRHGLPMNLAFWLARGLLLRCFRTCIRTGSTNLWSRENGSCINSTSSASSLKIPSAFAPVKKSSMKSLKNDKIAWQSLTGSCKSSNERTWFKLLKLIIVFK